MASGHELKSSDTIDLDVVRELISHFQPKDWQEGQELILAALQEINEHFGWVSIEAAEIVAEQLGTTVNRVYGLLTFYADFRTEPRGKHFMLLCHGMSCYVMGSQRLVQKLADQHGIGDGGTTADGGLTVQVVNGCLGVCDKAPVVKMDDEYFGELSAESFSSLVDQVLSERKVEAVK